MPRLALVATCLALAFALMPAPRAGAASPPSGTISCPVFPVDPTYLELRPYISAEPSTGRVLVKGNMVGNCDNSGVVGGKGPILSVEAKLIGKLTVGTTCSSLVNAPNFDRLRVKMKWKTTDANGREKLVATTTASFVDASWNDTDEALVFSSQPLKGAFAGSTSTVTLTLNNAAFYEGPCPPIVGAGWGADGESSITIP